MVIAHYDPEERGRKAQERRLRLYQERKPYRGEVRPEKGVG
jgi:hypothetical protein